jgi:CTP synthase
MVSAHFCFEKAYVKHNMNIKQSSTNQANPNKKTSQLSQSKNTKYIFVTGGVCSSLGKGIASASIGNLLKASGYKVFMQKLDPYLNVDPGTMSPFQHGEVFVTDDGAETDLDLGHYERFIDTPLSQQSSVSTGQVYTEVLADERKGTYLGGTIQIIPHITNAIQKRVTTAAQSSKCDIMLVELGGTVGDIEGQPFIESIRQLRHKLGPENTLFVHLTLLPWLAAARELKTKPTQQSVRELRSMGVQPDIIMTRADQPIPKKLLKKVSDFCDVSEDAVIPLVTASSIYEVPLMLEKHNVTSIIARKLGLKPKKADMKEWKKFVAKVKSATKKVTIGIAGKYTDLDDAYLSVIEATQHAAFHHNHKAIIEWIDTEKIEKGDAKALKKLNSIDGVIVPGGFGPRGIEGKIEVAKYCRLNKVPYLGLCLGCQVLTIEYARNVANIPNATSQEFDSKSEHQIIKFLPGQSESRAKGGTLRLGTYPAHIQKGTLAHKCYKTSVIHERHRHRYEITTTSANPFYSPLKDSGLIFSAVSPDKSLAEIVEVPNHPFMIGSQFHPEFLSRPHKPHPLFREFIKASIK